MQNFFFKVLIGLVCCLVLPSTGYANERDRKLPKYKLETIGSDIEVINASKKTDGFWIFSPQGEAKPADNVVLFMHGYGAYNPMIFGAWIRHLVEKGNIVIYPRYQKTLYSPTPKKFVKKTLIGLKNALRVLEARGVDAALWSDLDLIGHSYGGVIATNLAQNVEAYGIPPIRSLMICSAGSGVFKGGVLESYDRVEANLIIIDSEGDHTVGDRFSKLVDGLTPGKKNKVYLHQYACQAGDIRLTSHHNEPYALDLAFDNGVRNYTAKKALRVGYINLLDTAGYWKLFDRLIADKAEFILFDKEVKAWSLSAAHPSVMLKVAK